MNVLVIEYEKLRAQRIRDLLFQIDDSIQIVGIMDDMKAAADWLARNKAPDLILANELMMASVDAEALRGIRTNVTFSTSSGNYNFAAFRYKTMRQLMHHLQVPVERLGAMEQLWHQSERPWSGNGYKERFLVKQGQRLLSIPVGQVAYFFSQDRFIFFKTFDNQKFLLEYRMDQLENMLAPGTFFRINRSYIISLPTVREIHSYFGNRLKLYLTPSPDKEIIVSRKRVNDFKAWLGK